MNTTIKNLLWLSAGIGMGYFLAQKHLRDEYDAIASEEIANAKKYYENLYSHEAEVRKQLAEEASEVRTQTANDAAEALLKYQGKAIKDIRPPLPEPMDEPDDEGVNVDFEEESDPNAPYIIDEDTFMHAEVGYKQFCLTYFVGDKVLAGESDKVITNPDEAVGLENLAILENMNEDRFYIRNRGLGFDFEVTRSEGKYSVEVEGLTDA